MVGQEDITSLRLRVAALGPSRPGRRIPEDLRGELRLACAALADQLTQREIAEAFGLSLGTVQRWLRGAVPVPASMVPVEIVESAPSALRLVTPRGFVVEGLNPATAAELLRYLR
ncbi:MAG: helix-turn-helix domain-containing protein [Myxococcota bacterium]